MKQLIPVMFLVAIAACATQSPEPNSPVSAKVAESVSAKTPVADAAADDDGLLVGQSSAGDYDGVIKEVEAPDVTQSSVHSLQDPSDSESEYVCEWVVQTGSIMRKKVCRLRSEIERREEHDQKMIGDIKRNTANAASRF